MCMLSMNNIISLIIFISLILGFIIFIYLSYREDKNKNKNTINIVKCPNCGHDSIQYKDEDIITYKYSGTYHKVIECPKCKKYINI